MRIAYRERRAKTAPQLPAQHTLTNALVKSLPFPLTRAQRRAQAVIGKDLAQAHPMRRLLQGDVGSGKTIVAAIACLVAADAGWQAAVMAPTEILSEQHWRKFGEWFGPLGVIMARLQGGTSRKNRSRARDAQVIIGTHALIQEGVELPRLGLAVVDEQHRFGVRQRLDLRLKAKEGELRAWPHQLMMSATPIPRTLALTDYSELEVSKIADLPPGRRPASRHPTNPAAHAQGRASRPVAAGRSAE